jgi:hypothetical protein
MVSEPHKYPQIKFSGHVLLICRKCMLLWLIRLADKLAHIMTEQENLLLKYHEIILFFSLNFQQHCNTFSSAVWKGQARY